MTPDAGYPTRRADCIGDCGNHCLGVTVYDGVVGHDGQIGHPTRFMHNITLNPQLAIELIHKYVSRFQSIEEQLKGFDNSV